MSDGNEIIRRLHEGGILSETVYRWHRAEQGPGTVGGRTYVILYGPDGRVRVDLTGGYYSSAPHTLWVEPGEVRPLDEWKEHLLRTGQHPTWRSFCSHCGREKKRADFSCPEGCADPRPEW